MTESTQIIHTGLVWLRPYWLWLLLPIASAAALWIYRESRILSAWNEAVDPELRTYVLEGDGPRSRRFGLVLVVIWVLVVLLLAGPVFEQRDEPLTDAHRSEVLLVDLSLSMTAEDLPPSRISRARFKLADLLDRVGGDRLALVAFAERPYVISPLTDDVQTLRAFLPSLAPELLPAQGSRLDLAIDKGLELLTGAGVLRGHIVLVTDAVPDQAAMDAARRVAEKNHALSVLAVGTRAGAPLRDTAGGFVNDSNGQIVIPRLDPEALRALARAGGGLMSTLTSDEADIAAIENLRRRAVVQSDSAATSDEDQAVSNSLQWVERGPWIVPLIAFLALYLFRRGVMS